MLPPLGWDGGRGRRLWAARPEGHREFFVHLINSADPVLLDDIDERIRTLSRSLRPASGRPWSRTASRRRSARRSRGSPPSPARRGSSSARRGGVRETRPRPRSGDEPTRWTSRSCSAATGRCCARSAASSARRPGDRSQLRPRRLLASITRDELESGLARVFAGEYRVEDLPTLDVEVGDERRVAVNDLVIASAVVGRMIQLEWAVGGEGAGRLAVRRRRLLDSLRLDRLQPLERRPRARLGPRRDGDHLRRAALAQRPASCRPARRRADRLEPHARRAGDRARGRAPRGRPCPWRTRRRRVGEQRSRLATLPEVTFFSRYSRTFAS